MLGPAQEELVLACQLGEARDYECLAPVWPRRAGVSQHWPWRPTGACGDESLLGAREPTRVVPWRAGANNLASSKQPLTVTGTATGSLVGAPATLPAVRAGASNRVFEAAPSGELSMSLRTRLLSLIQL